VDLSRTSVERAPNDNRCGMHSARISSKTAN
jgi:hypothetical protein